MIRLALAREKAPKPALPSGGAGKEGHTQEYFGDAPLIALTTHWGVDYSGAAGPSIAPPAKAELARDGRIPGGKSILKSRETVEKEQAITAAIEEDKPVPASFYDPQMW